jgi:hypothetical protein
MPNVFVSYGRESMVTDPGTVPTFRQDPRPLDAMEDVAPPHPEPIRGGVLAPSVLPVRTTP